MSTSTELGERREVTLPHGTIRYRERGQGEPVVFVHPMIVNGDMWRKVVPRLADSYRCIAPDWPLGGHTVPMHEGTDLNPPGVALIVSEFLDALGLEDVTLVGCDTGGAIAQLVAAEHRERLGRLVLINCDAFDNFPPPAAKPLVWLSAVPGLRYALARLGASSRLLQRSPLVFGWLTRVPIEDEVARAYLGRITADRGVMRDARRALKGLAPGYTLAAARKLPEFDRPALVVWSPEDKFFPLEHARRLVETIPDARLELVEDSYTFMPEDQPERLAELLREFMAGRTGARH